MAARLHLPTLLEDIRVTYLNNPHPWVIGYSGGKDSTASLQLIWMALSELPPEALVKPVHVISTDTLVETPVIVNHVRDTLEQVESVAQERGLPFHTHLLRPETEDSFCQSIRMGNLATQYK